MRLLSIMTAAAMFAAPPAPAQAQPAAAAGVGPSSIELMKLCFNGATAGNITDPVCTGYLAGFIGAVRIAMTVSEDFPICLPDRSIPNAEIVDDVSAYLEANQEKLEASARSIVFLVLTQKFPCAAPPR